MRAPTCALCGLESARDVRFSWVRWRHPEDGKTWEAINRCTDRAACRERVEAQGEDWPVRDAA